ncbi:MAG TPA: hypothetical protein ENJ82_09720 [Bacteroidetes bacterium]|nr:hypothetical protein [Bacteroidota bacterium]
MEGYLYLGLSVLMMVLLFTCLREIPRFRMNLLHVVTTNYFVAAAIGLLFFAPEAFTDVLAVPGASILAIAIGGLFFGLFFLMGITAQKVGVMYMTIVTKMAVAIPVLFAWLYYSEAMPRLRAAGVLLALGAVLLVNYRPGNPVTLTSSGKRWMNIMLIAILFIGSGATDSLFKVFNVHFAKLVPNASFTVALFAVSAMSGALVVGIQLARHKAKIQGRSLLGGLLMGIPNFFSIIFLTKSLEYFDATVFYPVNNTLILVAMSLIGLLIYRERFNPWNLIGLALAVIAVLMLM